MTDDDRRETGGVFIVGAILLIALVIGVTLIWNKWLKRRDGPLMPTETRQQSPVKSK